MTAVIYRQEWLRDALQIAWAPTRIRTEISRRIREARDFDRALREERHRQYLDYRRCATSGIALGLAVGLAVVASSCSGLSPATSARLEASSELRACRVELRGDRAWTVNRRPDEQFRARDCAASAERQCREAGLESSCASDESWGSP
jgi:hypothetical protein